MKIKITKIDIVAQPLHKTANIEEYICGEVNTLSPFVGYEVVGELVEPITCGRSIKMNRESRNGIKIEGFFQTSIVNFIDTYENVTIVKTDNSIYKVEEIDE